MSESISHLIDPQVGKVYRRLGGDTLRFVCYDVFGDPTFMPVDCDETYSLNSSIDAALFGVPAGSVSFDVTVLTELEEVK